MLREGAEQQKGLIYECCCDDDDGNIGEEHNDGHYKQTTKPNDTTRQ